MFQRIWLDTKASPRLRTLSSKTGLRPNIIARFALAVSLKDDINPDILRYNKKGMEMNRITLTGDHDTFILSLIKLRLCQQGIDMDETSIKNHLTGHINRGIFILYESVKTINDLLNIIITANNTNDS